MASMKMLNICTWRGNSKLEEASNLRREIINNYEIFLSEEYEIFISNIFNENEELKEFGETNSQFSWLSILADVIIDYHALNRISLAKQIMVREEGLIEKHTLEYKGKHLILESLTDKKGKMVRYRLIPCQDIDILTTPVVALENLKLFVEAMLKNKKNYALEEINNSLIRLKNSGLSNEEIINCLQLSYTSLINGEPLENKPSEEIGVKLS